MNNVESESGSQPQRDGPAAEASGVPADAPPTAATRVGEAGDSAYTVMGLDAETSPAFADRYVGGKIGKYEIRALLGQGGMGAVYLAFDPLIEREVALKILSQAVGGNSSALQRFLGEARAIGRLNSPHVVAIYDIDQWEGQYYLVMELLSGGSVAQLSKDGDPVPWNVACQIVLEAARGLQSAHAAGMIHRDIKPENLMLTGEGTVKVVDFGLSKLVDAAQDTRTAVTRAGQILGTPQYMSPEQFESADVDARTDIYSLGGTLFRLLTGRFPYHDCGSIVQVMAAHMNQPPPVPTQFADNVPEACNVIVATAMAKKIADRYQTAADFAADLQSLVQLGTSSGGASSGAPVDDDRELASVLILEPSKLQGAMLKDGFSRAGAKEVHVVGTIADARDSVERNAPDLLITAMELPDGRGIDLLRTLAKGNRLRRTTVVLNTSEPALDELISVGSVPCVVLAPKKVKADEIQRIVHAASALSVNSSVGSAPIDPAKVSLRIVLGSSDLPSSLADLVRRASLLNVDVVAQPADGVSHANLALHLGSSATAINSRSLSALERGDTSAVLHVDGDRLTLRAVARGGIVAVTERPFDMKRLERLLQSCHR